MWLLGPILAQRMALLMEDQTTVAPRGWDMAIDPAIWAKVRERYVKGDRLTVLSDEFGLKYGTVSKKAQQEGWRKLREEYEENSRKAVTTPEIELRNRATIERALGPQDDYIEQVSNYRASAEVLRREFEATQEELKDPPADVKDRVALRRTLIQLHERIQEALSIPSVKPVELRQSGSEKRTPAIPLG
jgi:hypothetical protein